MIKPSLEKSLLRSTVESQKRNEFPILVSSNFSRPTLQPQPKNYSQLGELGPNFVQRMRKRIVHTQKVSFHNSTLRPSYSPRANANKQQRGREEDDRQGSSTRNPIHRAYSKRIGVSPSSVRPPSTLPFSLIPSSISQHTYTHTCTTVQRASSTILHQQSIMAAEFLTRASAPATSAKTSGDRYVRAQRITTPATREPVT